MRGQRPSWVISIHALLAESDYRQGQNILDALPISIHALLAESDALPGFFICGVDNFYPRSPCGERLCIGPLIFNVQPHFYPRSPCGERRSGHPETRRRDAISIHALLAESDGVSCLPYQLY